MGGERKGAGLKRRGWEGAEDRGSQGGGVFWGRPAVPGTAERTSARRLVPGLGGLWVRAVLRLDGKAGARGDGGGVTSSPQGDLDCTI